MHKKHCVLFCKEWQVGVGVGVASVVFLVFANLALERGLCLLKEVCVS